MCCCCCCVFLIVIMAILGPYVTIIQGITNFFPWQAQATVFTFGGILFSLMLLRICFPDSKVVKCITTGICRYLLCCNFFCCKGRNGVFGCCHRDKSLADEESVGLLEGAFHQGPHA